MTRDAMAGTGVIRPSIGWKIFGLAAIIAGVAACGSPEAFASERSAPPRGDTGPDTARITPSDLPRHRSTVADRESVAITVYNQNFGLVREIRNVALSQGIVELEFADVASAIQTETVNISAVVLPRVSRPFRVLEQNYQYDLLSPQKLLEKYVGRTVSVYRFNRETEREEVVEAEVLSVNNGTILRIGDEITFNYPGRIAFPELPDDLIAEPTLLWKVDSPADGARLEVSYLANSLGWRADYVMVVDEDDDEAGLTGWVTLTNNSGATYENASLKLVAGDVQRIVGDLRDVLRKSGLASNEPMPEEEGFSEEGFFEYHLYTLGRPTTVKNNEQKQVTLLEAAGFDVTKRLIFYGAEYYYRGQYGEVVSNQKVDVRLEFENSEDNRLGMPLPAGVVRVYKEDESGAQQFIGEDRIDHTPRDERIRIRMGDAFDVVGDRRQMDWTALGSCVSESTWEVQLRNHKDDDVEVDVIEPIGGDWDILSSSHRSTKLDAHTFRFRVDVPARGETTIDYRVRVRWC